MRKKRVLKLRVFLLTLLAFLGLGGLGHSYAYLISQLQISSNLKTGEFDNVFATDRMFTADIVNMASDDKEIIKSVNIEANVVADGKSVDVVFKEGVPTELLDENNYLKISYPLDEKGTTNLLPYELDLTKEAEKITMNVKKAFISISGNVYEYDYANTVFNKPIVFDAYRSIDIIDDKPIGNLYLKRVDSSKFELPKKIEFKQSEVDNLVPVTEEVFGQYAMPQEVTEQEDIEQEDIEQGSIQEGGIQVVYFCEFDVHIDQAEAGEVIGK